MNYSTPAVDVNDAPAHWSVRLARFVARGLRPHLGWAVFLCCVTLGLLPALALGMHRWPSMRAVERELAWVGALAVAAAWAVMGWRRPRPASHPLGTALKLLLLLALGGLVVSQTFGRWLPRWDELWHLLRGEPLPPPEITGGRLAQLAGRVAFWWEGVQGGGAAQDNTIFGLLAGALVWGLGLLTAWLARTRRSGLLAGLPALWAAALVLLYADRGRPLLVAGLAVVLLLHLALDHERLVSRWQAAGVDYTSTLWVDRLVAVGGVAVLVLTLAYIAPNFIIRPLVWRYYELLGPANERVEAWGERMFPALQGRGGLFGPGVAGGLPNAFLLDIGPDAAQVEVLRVRTGDAPPPMFAGLGPDDPPPRGPYLRGATFALYDGKGWDNPPLMEQRPLSANSEWASPDWEGRRPLLQSVELDLPTQVFYAAGEPLAVGADARVQQRGETDLVALLGGVRRYTASSIVPALSEAELAALPAWGPDNPPPPELAEHLALPDTITQRTRALAAELTAGLGGYAAAQAIESYLRGFTYDLDAPRPPQGVADVADYFLFDLQRGYCDYYATAFVVLARLAGLPARFATGFAPGAWDVTTGYWIVTDGEAHSWPEVYLPQAGWIPFEPTAGRAALARVGLPQGATAAPMPAAQDEAQTEWAWSWQMLVWLLPLGLLAWGGWSAWQRRRLRREEPWAALLRWGRRAGRPPGEGDTILEYGAALGGWIAQRQAEPADAARRAAREMGELSGDTAQARYGPPGGRTAAETAARARWLRLRELLARLRLR